MADFAPYQDQAPETHRALSPPLPSASPRHSPRTSIDRTRSIGTAAVTSPHAQHFSSRDYVGARSPPPVQQEDPERVAWNAVPGAFGGGREDVDMFETRLGLRMDYEACLAYLLLPPAGAVLLLILEHRSDYVRFHAWQSALLFAFLFVIHIIFSWSSIISWLLFVGDIGLIGFLTMHAYQDAATLDRFEIPFFGPLASSILDDE